MKHNILTLLCTVTILLNGCTAAKPTESITEPPIEIIESKQTEQTSEITESEQTKQTSEITESEQTKQTSEITAPILIIENNHSETETTLKTYIDDTIYIGEYLDSVVHEPTLEIEKIEDGKYIVQIIIYRIAFLSDGIGKMTADGMSFTATDPAGNPISGIIQVAEQTATVTFTDSTWDYLKNGSVLQYTKSSDTPNIFWSDIAENPTLFSDSTSEISSLLSYTGTWQLDAQKTEENLKEGYSLQTIFGTGIHYGASMEISEDGSFSYYIGIGAGGTGQLEAEESGFAVAITPYEAHSDILEVLHLKIESDSDKLYLVIENYFDGNDLYWTQN